MKRFKKSVAVLSAIAMSAAMLLNFPAGMPAVSAEDTHNYDSDGFCSDPDCTAYQPANQTTDKYDINGDGENDKVYEIENAGQLYWFAGLVNGDRTNVCKDGITQNASANAILTKDITVNKDVVNTVDSGVETNFTNWKTIDYFTGNFNGNGKTIKGLYLVSDGSITNIGMFKCSAGSISNLNIEDSYFNHSGSYTCIGGICAENKGTIANCSFSGKVVGKFNHIGGICGKNYATIESCENKGTIIGDDFGYIGGISGGNNGNSALITKCVNSGEIKRTYPTDNDHQIGGICGWNDEAKIDSCYNIANVTGKGSGNTGGICGYNTAANDNSSYVLNCYNTGTVSEGTYVGEICGYNLNSGSYDQKINDAVIENCFYPAGTQNEGVGISENYSESGGELKNNTQEKSTDAFKSGEVAYLLAQGNSVWGQTLSGTDQQLFPVLGGKKVLKNIADGTYKNGVSITGYNLYIDENINLQVYVYIDEDDKYSVDDVTATFNGSTINKGLHYIDLPDNVYCYEYKIPAKDLDKNFKFEVKVNGQDAVLETSANDYLDIISSDPKYTEIANALKTYGMAAKAYFENSETPVKVDDVPKSELSKYQMILNEENLPDGMEYIGSTLLLDSTTTIRHYFKFDEIPTAFDYNFYTADGYPVKLNRLSADSNIYYTSCSEFMAMNMGNSFSLMKDGKLIIENCSILSYATSVISSRDKNLSNLAKAIYLYNKAAVNYHAANP